MGRLVVLAVALLVVAGAAAPAVAGAPAVVTKAPAATKVAAPARKPPLPVLDAKALFARLDRARKAHRRVVVHFWATWCPPCVRELPRVLKAVPTWRRHAEVLLLAVVQPRDAALARKMVGPGPGRFRLSVDDPSVLAARLDRSWNGGLPATFVLDGRGKVVYRVVGPMDDESVNRALGIPRAR